MTTMAPETERPAGVAQCGCCGRRRPARRLTELGSTPGVFICTSCALWVARRSTPFPVVRLDPAPRGAVGARARAEPAGTSHHGDPGSAQRRP
jgi:hypothetical protein